MIAEASSCFCFGMYTGYCSLECGDVPCRRFYANSEDTRLAPCGGLGLLGPGSPKGILDYTVHAAVRCRWRCGGSAASIYTVSCIYVACSLRI